MMCLKLQNLVWRIIKITGAVNEIPDGKQCHKERESSSNCRSVPLGMKIDNKKRVSEGCGGVNPSRGSPNRYPSLDFCGGTHGRSSSTLPCECFLDCTTARPTCGR
jgi:hypothetical protein